MLRVLIADDHAIVRKGLKDILREASEPATVGEASNGQEALDLVAAQPWDVVILDITMPVVDGLKVLREVKRQRAELPVLMLSMHGSPQYVRGALKLGAAGYLSKESAPEELLDAIHAVMSGNTYISLGLRKAME